MQYATPQFIESEGKIVFFLTFKQFFTLVGAGAFCLFLYFILPFILFILCSILIIIFTLIVVFLKINNESIVKVFLSFITFSTATKNYVWNKKKSTYPLQVKKHYEIKNTQPSTISETKPPIQQRDTSDPSILKVQTGKLREIKKIVETKR